VQQVLANEFDRIKDFEDLKGGLLDKVFKALVQSNEAQRMVDYIARNVYERIDFNFIDNKNVYRLYL